MPRAAVCLCLLLIAGMASAQDKADDLGPYAGAGVAVTFEQFDLPYELNADDGYALSVFGGYRVSPGVSLELEAEILTGFDIGGSIQGGAVSGEIDGWTLSANAKLFPSPPNEQVLPFLLFGAGFFDGDGHVRSGGIKVSGDDSDWMLQLGGGIDFPLADRVILELKGSYRFLQGDLDDFPFWTAGANLQYRF